MVNEKKIQIFISSTFTDLEQERNEIIFGILKSEHIPAGMELFTAVGSQLDIIKKNIDNSDAYCLMIGSKYGKINTDTGMSYTEWEYQYAKESNKPIFVIVLDEDYINDRVQKGKLNIHDIEINSSEFIRFKRDVMNERLVAIIKDINEIKGEVQSCLQTIIKEYGENLLGWVSGSVIEMVEQRDKDYSQLLKTSHGKDIRIKNLERENTQMKSKDASVQQSFIEYVEELTKSNDGNQKTKQTVLFLRSLLKKIVSETKEKVFDEFNMLEHNHDGPNYTMATIDLKDCSIIFKANYESNEIAVKFSDKKNKIYKEIDNYVLSNDTFVSDKTGQKLEHKTINEYLEYLKIEKDDS